MKAVFRRLRRIEMQLAPTANPCRNGLPSRFGSAAGAVRRPAASSLTNRCRTRRGRADTRRLRKRCAVAANSGMPYARLESLVAKAC